MGAKSLPLDALIDPEFRLHFWAGVQPAGDDDCWPWMRSYSGKHMRYGQTFFKQKAYKAHRVAFALAKGYDANVARHSCDNPGCCNPRHLLDGTLLDNSRDRVERGRCNPPVGERSAQSKLTDELASQIRREYAEGGTSYTKLAAKYSVSFQLIGQLIQRKIWRHVQ